MIKLIQEEWLKRHGSVSQALQKEAEVLRSRDRVEEIGEEDKRKKINIYEEKRDRERWNIEGCLDVGERKGLMGEQKEQWKRKRVYYY